MNAARRLARLEGARPQRVVFAMFDHDGRPLNDAARDLAPGKPALRFTFTLDRPGHALEEEDLR